MEFTFDPRARRPIVSDEAIIRGLKRFAKRRGVKLRMADWDKWPARPVGSMTLLTRFGSWRDALRRAGIEGGRVGCYEAAELVERVEEVWRKTGRAPTVTEFIQLTGISTKPYSDRWGTFTRVR